MFIECLTVDIKKEIPISANLKHSPFFILKNDILTEKSKDQIKEALLTYKVKDETQN